MKHICITYHMRNASESAETCITLPMEGYIANDLLQRGTDSDFLNPALNSDVYKLLRLLSAIQGYEFIEAVSFESMDREEPEVKTCGMCKHCQELGHCGADCKCSVRSTDDIDFEVSQDDDIRFYGDRDGESCPFFAERSV